VRRFAPNLSILFPALPYIDRFRAILEDLAAFRLTDAAAAPDATFQTGGSR
jgi:hydroxypyruvate isomerase